MGIIRIAFPIRFTTYDRRVFKRLHILVGAGNLMEYVVRFNICKREFEVIRLPFKASSHHIPSGGFAFPIPLLQVLNGDICTFEDKGDAIVIWSLSKAKRWEHVCEILRTALLQ